MRYVRISAPLLFVAALAACSGNIGGGQSTLPGALPSGGGLGAIAPPPPSATPVAASNVASLGESTSAQPIPNVAGFGGTVVFPRPVATGSPNAKATASPGGAVAVGITASIVEPTDAPHFNGNQAKRRRLGGKRDDPSAPKPLLFISLLATSDVTLDRYPVFAIDVPRDIVTKYRDGDFGLALFDPARGKQYVLAVAERNRATSATGGSTPAGTPSEAPPVLAPTPAPSGSPHPGAPPAPAASAAPTLPPQRIDFSGTAASLALKANRAVVFALYALAPKPSPSAQPASSGSTPSPSPTATTTPVPAPRSS